MARPNELEPIVERAIRESVKRGITLREIADETGIFIREEKTVRGMKAAALRLFKKGRIVRAFEYYHPDGNPEGWARQYRYWTPEYAPANRRIEDFGEQEVA